MVWHILLNIRSLLQAICSTLLSHDEYVQKLSKIDPLLLTSGLLFVMSIFMKVRQFVPNLITRKLPSTNAHHIFAKTTVQMKP